MAFLLSTLARVRSSPPMDHDWPDQLPTVRYLDDRIPCQCTDMPQVSTEMDSRDCGFLDDREQNDDALFPPEPETSTQWVFNESSFQLGDAGGGQQFRAVVSDLCRQLQMMMTTPSSQSTPVHRPTSRCPAIHCRTWRYV